MSLVQYPTTITVDTPPREQSRNVPAQSSFIQPVIELWYGDVTSSNAIGSEDILVLSSTPAQTLIGNTAILKWGLSLLCGNRQRWFSQEPCLNVDVFPTSNKSIVHDLLFWNPSFGPLTEAQSAPYKTDDIFRGAQAMWGHIPKSIVIPLQIGNNGFCDSTILLESLLHSAIKLGGWREYIPSTIKIVLNQKNAQAFAAFDAIAKNYDGLRGGPNKTVGTTPPAGFPTSIGQSYAYFMDQANSWMKNMYGQVKGINPVTEFQAYAINIYTSSYFSPMQKVLINSLKTNAITPLSGTGPLTNYFGVGYTNLGDPDYRALIPLLATMSAGLSNIPAYHGATFRGAGAFWNAFTPGKGVRIVNYMSTADEFYGNTLPWPTIRFRDEWGRPYPGGSSPTTPAPWRIAKNHIRTQSLTARDISPYSMHQYEREHLYDFEFIEYVTSKESGGLTPPGAPMPVNANIASVQIPDSFGPLLK